MVRKKPACTSCGRPRRGHPGPIGVKCTLGKRLPPGLVPIGVPGDDQQGGGGGQPGDPPRGEPPNEPIGPVQPDIPDPAPELPVPNPAPGGVEGEPGGQLPQGPNQPEGPGGVGLPLVPQPPQQPQPGAPQPGPQPPQGPGGGVVPGAVVPVVPQQPGGPEVPQHPPQGPGGPQQPPQGPGGPQQPPQGPGAPVVPQLPVPAPVVPQQPAPAPNVPQQPVPAPAVPQQPVPAPAAPRQPVQVPVVPHQPGQVPVVPQQPGQVPAVPQQPGQVPVVPQQPGQVPAVPQHPGQVPVVPQHPGQVPVVPQQPGQVPVVPQQPGQVPVVPQQPGQVPVVPNQAPQPQVGLPGQIGMVGLPTDPNSVPVYPQGGLGSVPYYGYNNSGVYAHSNVNQNNVGSVAATLTQCGNLLSNMIPNSMYGLNNQDITRMVGQCIAQLSGVLNAGSIDPRVNAGFGGNASDHVSTVNGLGINDPRASMFTFSGANAAANQQPVVNGMNGVVHNDMRTGLGGNQPVANHGQPGGVNDTPTLAHNNMHVPGPVHNNGLPNMGAHGPDSWIYMTPQDGTVQPGYYSSGQNTTFPLMAGTQGIRASNRNNYPVGSIPYKLRSQGIPARVIDAAIQGEWTDLGEFIPQIGVNVNSVNTELEPVLDGNTVSYRPKKNRRQITNYDTWYVAWCNYEKLMISVHGVALHEIMCDYRTFIMEANKKYLWSSVFMYDQRHRARLGALLTLNERLNFSSPSQDLISTVLDATAVKPNAQRCQRCKSYDHSVGLCPFPEVKSSSQAQSKVKTQNSSQEICLNFNREKCNTSNCPRKHVCKQCRGPLPHTRCILSGHCSKGQVTPPT